MNEQNSDDFDRRLQQAKHAAEDRYPSLKKEKPEELNRGGMRVGAEFVTVIMVGAIGGYWLDQKFGTGPWCFFGLFFLGIIAGFTNLYRAISGLDQAPGFKRPDSQNNIDDEQDKDIDKGKR